MVTFWNKHLVFRKVPYFISLKTFIQQKNAITSELTNKTGEVQKSIFIHWNWKLKGFYCAEQQNIGPSYKQSLLKKWQLWHNSQ